VKQLIPAVATIVAALIAVPAAAQTAGAFMANPAFTGPRPARCTSTLEMQRCAANDLRAADVQMSAHYDSLRLRLLPVARQSLLSEQRAWLKSRDRDCLARGGGGGTMASLRVAQCWVAVTKARASALNSRLASGANGGRLLPASAFVGRWRGGEGTYMKISRRGSGFAIDNQWGLDADMQGTFSGTITPNGLSFRRQGVTETVRPGKGAATNRSALVGKTGCLIVSRDEGYCRY
jgi:uncharacterized protein YecT (DUF1311 family)